MSDIPMEEEADAVVEQILKVMEEQLERAKRGMPPGQIKLFEELIYDFLLDALRTGKKPTREAIRARIKAAKRREEH